VYTPILPLMLAQTDLSSEAGAAVAIANYVGYLAGACLGFALPVATRSPRVMRACLVVLVATLALMPANGSLAAWVLLRLVAGVVTAIIFIYTVNGLHAAVRAMPGLKTGWAFAGVGAGVVISGIGILVVQAVASWQVAWFVAATLAVALAAAGWDEVPDARAPGPTPVEPPRRLGRLFALLLLSYSLEGVGYIIAGTFLVAAAGETLPAWLASCVWIVVGIGAVPSVIVWNRLASRWSTAGAYAAALVAQVIGMIALPLLGGPVAALVASVLFGGTFVAISTLALALGARGGSPRAVAILTAGYSAGQIAGPTLVAPLLSRGYQDALLIGAVIVFGSAAAAVAYWRGARGATG